MTAVSSHEVGFQKSELSKKPAQNRNLEHHAHQQIEHHEGLDIRFERNKVRHVLANLIVAQKPYGERKNEKISQRRTDDEHGIARTYQRDGISALVGIQRRRHITEHKIEHIWSGAEHAGIERNLGMNHKLTGKSGVYQIDGEWLYRTDARQEPECNESALLWRKHNVEKFFLKEEGSHSKKTHRNHCADNNSAQLVEMFPKSHRFLFSHDAILFLIPSCRLSKSPRPSFLP